MNEYLKQRFLEYLSEMINDFDFSDVDGFMDDYEVEHPKELLDLKLKVVEEEIVDYIDLKNISLTCIKCKKLFRIDEMVFSSDIGWRCGICDEKINKNCK